MSSFDYLKTAIKQQGCTLQQVADASGMTKGYLSQLLNAKIKSPSAQKLEALHRFLGLEFPRQKKTIGVVFGKFYPLHTGHISLRISHYKSSNTLSASESFLTPKICIPSGAFFGTLAAGTIARRKPCFAASEIRS